MNWWRPSSTDTSDGGIPAGRTRDGGRLVLTTSRLLLLRVVQPWGAGLARKRVVEAVEADPARAS